MTPPLLVTAGRAVLGPAAQVVVDAGVLVEGGVVRAAGPRRQVEAATDGAVERRDFPAATIVPGLVDAHVHLAFDGGDDPAAALAATTPDELLLAMVDRAGQLVAAGVTTVRDLGDSGRATVALRGMIERGEVPGPRILAATTPLTSPGGHCWFLGGEVEGTAQIAALIRENALAGADLVKVMASGGALTPGGPPMWQGQFDGAALRTVVEEARAHGLPVAAHAHGTATIAECVRAGVATIEHCSWRTEDALVYDDAIAREIAAAGIGVCRCISGDWRAFLERMGENAGPLVASIHGMRAAGVTFVAGTDAGVPGSRFGDVVGMLEFFAGIGFAGPEVLDMATVDAARVLGVPDTGRLAEGLRADLVVVDGDPLVDLSTLRDPLLVVAAGRIVSC